MSETTLLAFIGGRLSLREMKTVVLHLFGCPCCTQDLKSLYSAEAATAVSEERRHAAQGAAIETAFGRTLDFARTLEREREEIARLLPHLRDDREALRDLADERSLSALGMVELLLALSFEERYRSPATMYELAFYAEIAARHLRVEDYGPFLVADVNARALAELANAHRVLDNFADADRVLSRASAWRRKGTGSLTLMARIADVAASIEADRRNMALAYELLEKVAELYREVGDLHLAGRALVSRGIYANRAGYALEGLAFLREGMDLLDPDRDPQLFATSQQAYIMSLLNSGNVREAERLFLTSDLRRRLPAPLNQTKIRWLEGRICRARSRWQQATAAFAEVETTFEALGEKYHAALASLDRASVMMREGHIMEARTLCRRTAKTLFYLGIPKEAKNAVVHLAAMSDAGLLTAGTVEYVGSFLEDLEGNPELRFNPLPL